MSISMGTRVGSYEVLAPLGAGGMGEVYRARDSKLNRDVALKILPPEFSSDKERRLRFEQEARAASALNHPNVVQIYDVGASDKTIYIAMQLVEGRTLREVLSSAPLPTKKILDLAVQIADGIARAHEAGIVHRDLKPENIMVSRDGHVSILDFGLAKLVEPAAGDIAERSTSPHLTRAGMVVGTLGYMSPEQAAGRTVDYRSDQFALGAIVYEMASGGRAFQRETGPETLTAILREEPESLSQRAPGLPAPLRWIVEERCLAKDPEDRYSSTRDLHRELKGLREHLSEAAARGLAPLPPSARRRWLGFAAAALGIACALALGIFFGKRSGASSSNELPRFQRLTFRRGAVLTARFAPDEQTIVYGAYFDSSEPEILSTRTDSSESRSLGLPSGNLLSISSAGEMAISLGQHRLIGWEYTGTLGRVPLAGGAPREILDGVEVADWTPDGKNLAVVRDMGGRRRLEFPVDHVLYETAGFISSPRVSPKGDLIAFLDNPVRGDNGGSVAVVDLSGRKTTLSSPCLATAGLDWSPSGEEIWFAGARSGARNDLWAVDLSGRERLLWRESGDMTLHDIATDGRVLMSRVNQTREIAGLAPGASEERNLSWLDWSFPRDLSDDGRLVLFDEQGEGAGPSGYSIYLRKTDGSPAVRLGEGLGLGLSPDATWALGQSGRESGQTLLVMPIGAGMPKTAPLASLVCPWAGWLPDGKRVLLSANEPEKLSRLYLLDLSDGSPRPITEEGVSIVTGGQRPISPDGKVVAARGPDGVMYFYPIEGGEPRPAAGVLPEELVIRWTADGRGLYVHRPSEVPTRIFVVDVATGRRTFWKQLAPADSAGIEVIRPVLLSGDGKAYVYSFTRRLEDLYLVQGLH
jgi:serine/threonine protein kinase